MGIFLNVQRVWVVSEIWSFGKLTRHFGILKIEQNLLKLLEYLLYILSNFLDSPTVPFTTIVYDFLPS